MLRPLWMAGVPVFNRRMSGQMQEHNRPAPKHFRNRWAQQACAPTLGFTNNGIHLQKATVGNAHPAHYWT